MLSPGFIIKNDTIWPLQISLNQVGPLYYGVVPPGEEFRRDTGAVWFTLKGAVFLDEKDRITTWDAIWPIGAVTVGVLLTAATAGAAAYAAGPAMAAAGGATGAVLGTTTGLSATALAAVSVAAQGLVGAGFSASAALVVGGVVVSGTAAAATGVVTAALKDVFTKQNTAVSKAGCYAGPPWPFRKDLHAYRITGGPFYRAKPETNQVELIGAPLVLTH